MTRRQGSALDDTVVVDLSMTGSETADTMPRILCQLLSGAGALVIRVAAPVTPDKEPDRPSCPAHPAHGEPVLFDQGNGDDPLSRADVVIVRDVDAIADVADSVVVVVIDEGDLVDSHLPIRSHELVAQTVTGAVLEHIPGRPAYNGMQLGTYGSAINAATAVVAALIERLGTGLGQRITVSLSMGVIGYMGLAWSGVNNRDEAAERAIPVGADVPLFKCSDGEYICLSSSPRCPNPLVILKDLLELDVHPDALRGSRSTDDLTNYYYNYDAMAEGFQRVSSVDILDQLRRADFAAEIVRPPGHAWVMEDVIESRLVETCPHCHAEFVGFPIEGI